MDSIIDNWPILLAALGAFVIIFGMIKKVVKLAVFGLVLLAAGFVLLQVIA